MKGDVALPIRNIGILAHIDAGKTTLTEQLLVWCGAIRRPGWVDEGSSVADWQRQERERGITIGSAAITGNWQGTEVTIVDTPGHVDFTMEVERSLRVIDGAILVVSGPDGVQAQTETVWHQAERHEIPAIGFCNKLDCPGFDDEEVQRSIRDRLGIEPLPLQLPLSFGGEALELLDVLSGEVIVWDNLGKKQAVRACGRRQPTEEEVVLRELALERVIDTVASQDDRFAEEVLAGGAPSPERFLLALRAATQARACMPLLYGVARSGAGIHAVARAVLELLPAPDQAKPPGMFEVATGRPATLAQQPGGWPAVFVFKTESLPGEGRIALVRAFGGELTPQTVLRRQPGGAPLDRLRIIRSFGGEAEPADRLPVGAIGGVVLGPDDPLLVTGDTLAAPDLGLTFEPIVTPEPVIGVVLEAPDEARDAELRAAVRQLTIDDPSLVASTDPQTGQLVLYGMGELHLEIAVERLREARLEVSKGRPRAHLRQVALRPASGVGQDTSDQAPRARVEVAVQVSPMAEAIGQRYELPEDLDPGVGDALVSGLDRALGRDGSLPRPVVGVVVQVRRVESTGARPHPAAYMRAAHAAASSAFRAAGLVLAEPWMALSIVVVDEHVGRVVGDLARRRGRVRATEARGTRQVLSARAPLAEVLGYATDLRSLTGGRGLVTMQPCGYEPLPDAN
jgi:elongation factor G